MISSEALVSLCTFLCALGPNSLTDIRKEEVVQSIGELCMSKS